MVSVESSNAVKELYGKIKEIPSLPQLYYTIKNEVDDPNSSIVRIGELISADQGLTTRLLRLTNSAVFGFVNKIDTISEAVSLIGLQQVRDLSLCTMVIETFGSISSDLLDMKGFWKHSLGCGITARALAAYKRLPNIERFFVNGVTHDIGRLMMLTAIPGQMREIFHTAHTKREMVYKVERDKLGYDHGDVGAVLMQMWKLPDMVVESASMHHRPTLSTVFPDEVSIVHIADVITHGMEIGNSGEPNVPPLIDATWRKLGLKPTVLSSMMRDIDRQADEVARIMLSAGK
jgi:HD-like signal output (HDOD) protein